MKKKTNIICYGITLVLLIGLIIYTAVNHQYSDIVKKDGITYQVTNDGAYITDGTNAKKDTYFFTTIKKKRIVGIKEEAFKNNTTIKNINAPYIKYVGSNSFENSTIEEFDALIKEGDISGESPLIIDYEAFKDCTSLDIVKLPKTELYADSFLNCGEFDLTISDDSYVQDEQLAPLFCISPFRNTSLGSVEFIKTTLGTLCFENGVLFSKRFSPFNAPMELDEVYDLNRKSILYVQSDVTELAFEDDDLIVFFAGASDSIKRIKVNSTNPYYSTYNGALYSKDYTSLIYLPSKASSLELNSAVKRVYSSAFYGNYENKSLEFSKDIKFRYYTFVGVKNLDVTFNNPENLNSNAVYDCLFD